MVSYIKEYIRSLLRTVIRAMRPVNSGAGIVIASSGRAGSTMVFDSVVEAVFGVERETEKKRFFERKIRSGFSAYLFNPPPYDVTKTHSLPFKLHGSGLRRLKVVYIHGDPWDALLSAKKYDSIKGNGWLIRHVKNLSGDACAVESFCKKDLLDYARQIREWHKFAKANPSSVFVVGYEDLWDQEAELWSFLGLDRGSLPQKNIKRKLIANDEVPDLYRDLRELRFGLFGR